MKNKSTANNNRRGSSTRWLVSLIVGIVGATGIIVLNQQTVDAADIVVYTSPTCGCCTEWVKHLEDNGFSVEVHNRRDMDSVKAQLGVPRHLQSCHTARIGDYLIEGHVPAGDIRRLLADKPAVAGLTAPGMPMGSPGMEGPRRDPYDVLTFKPGDETTVFSSHNQ